jgi:4'-phosphopantetheinyl transferase
MNYRTLTVPGAEVVVSCTSVPPTREVLASLWEVLDDAEREKARRFAFERDANLFVTAHALLRYALWRTNAPPNSRFSVGQFGKPELDPPYGNPPLRFNLSHSAAFAVCALCFEYDVGVDVEAVGDNFQFEEVAAHFFTPHERAQLACCQPDARSATFLRIWTLKEALMKATGQGFSGPMNDFDVTVEPLTFSNAAAQPTHANQWHIEQRKVSEQHWASVAIRRPPGIPILVNWASVAAAEIVEALGRRNEGGV